MLIYRAQFLRSDRIFKTPYNYSSKYTLDYCKNTRYGKTIFRIFSFHLGRGYNRIAYDFITQPFTGSHYYGFMDSARVQVRQVLD